MWFVYCTHTQRTWRKVAKVFCACLSLLLLLSFTVTTHTRTHTHREMGACAAAQHVSGKIDYEMIYWPQKLLQYWLKLLPFFALFSLCIHFLHLGLMRRMRNAPSSPVWVLAMAFIVLPRWPFKCKGCAGSCCYRCISTDNSQLFIEIPKTKKKRSEKKTPKNSMLIKTTITFADSSMLQHTLRCLLFNSIAKIGQEKRQREIEGSA